MRIPNRKSSLCKENEIIKLFFENLTMAPIEKDLINCQLIESAAEKNYLSKLSSRSLVKNIKDI